MPQAKVNGKTVHLPYNKAGRDLARRLARGPFTDEMKQRLKALAEASKQERFATLQPRRPSRPVPMPMKKRPREKPIATAVKLAKSGKTDAAIEVARASIGLPPLKKKKR